MEPVSATGLVIVSRIGGKRVARLTVYLTLALNMPRHSINPDESRDPGRVYRERVQPVANELEMSPKPGTLLPITVGYGMFFSVARVRIVVLALPDLEIIARADGRPSNGTGDIRVSRRDHDIRIRRAVEGDVQGIHGDIARLPVDRTLLFVNHHPTTWQKDGLVGLPGDSDWQPVNGQSDEL
jgi:hypothetical protein